MDKPTDSVEYETMLLGRHSMTARGKRGGGLLDRSAYILLSRLRVEGPMSIRQLSEAFGLDASTLNRQTAAMTRDGLVQRISDAEGGIARKFRITEEGAQRLDRERAEIVGWLDKVVVDWTPEEVTEFAGWLKRFNTEIERLGGRPWPRP